MGFHQLYERPRQFLGMHEGDLGAPSPDARLLIYQPDTLVLEVSQSRVDRWNRIGHMMETGPVLRQETAYRSLRRQRLQKLHKRPADRDHGFFDTLLFDNLAIERSHTVLAAILGQSLVQVWHCDRYMVQVEELHSG